MRTPTARQTARLTAIALTLVAAALWAEAPKPAEPGPKDRCAVCGMLVAPHPEWIAQVAFEDGSSAFFDGSKDLFKYLLNRGRYLAKKQGLGLSQIYVTTYYDVQRLAARDAVFVAGSDVLGPMGPELIPLASAEAAEEFMRDHGGRKVLHFDEITMDVIRGLQ